MEKGRIMETLGTTQMEKGQIMEILGTTQMGIE